MKAICINCSNHFGHRTVEIKKVLEKMGYEVEYYVSDFDHDTKLYYEFNGDFAKQIHVREYHRNLSVDRLLSHYEYSRDVFRFIEKGEEPDLIYALLPPNSLTKFASAYKRKHPSVKLVFDIFDMWPETFPFGKLKKLLTIPFNIWAGLRNKYLQSADLILTECDYFAELLEPYADKNKLKPLYLTRPVCSDLQMTPMYKEVVKLLYIGAINNIIDIQAISNVIRSLSNHVKVELHVVGGGERKEELVFAAKNNGANVIEYGFVYDTNKLLSIAKECHYGLNVMKRTVCVGLTMKSLDYYRYSLPIINTIPGDTKRIVEQERIGINLEFDSEEECSDKILNLSESDYMNMQHNVEHIFNTLYSNNAFQSRAEAIFKESDL